MPTHHVIIGGGPAATNAVETIRQFETEPSRITLVSDEPAHSRMALPYWLANKIPREQTYTGDDAYFQQLKVDTRFGVRANKLNVDSNTLTLDDGASLDFDNLLLATGSMPLAPPIPGTELPGVEPLWTLADTQKVLDAAQAASQPRVVLVGAGFIGFIVLNAMFKRGWKLTVVERESQVLPRMLDDGAAPIVESWLAQRGVDVHTGISVTGIGQSSDGEKQVELTNGQTVTADIVIVATGIQANLDLVVDTGIKTDQGILVNDRMQSSLPQIYAAGDVAQGPVLFGDKPAIHAIQTTAVDHGRIAGANMAAHDVQYPGSLLMNIVDVCGLQCASFGRWDDTGDDATTIRNDAGFVYRKLLWNGEQLVGAIFTGRANDMGMLNDVGMVKGILQTQTPLGPWKSYLTENPFDIRRAYVAIGVANKLAASTLLGRPSQARGFRFKGTSPKNTMGPSHAVYVGTKEG